MKNIISIFVLFLALSSCTNYGYVQIYEIKSNYCENNNMFMYSNEDCDIAYNFWAEGGDGSFTFKNKTDKNIFLILPLSSFIRNGLADAYDSPLMLETGNNESRLTSKTVCMPPRTSKIVKGFSINTNVRLTCDGNASNYPKKSSFKINYSPENTPLSFTNRVAYCLDGELSDVKYVENIFYISSIQNYAEKSLIEYYEICEDGFVVKKSKYKMRAFDKFYNKYNRKTELDIPYSQVKRSVNKTSKNESKKELVDDVYITHK